MNITPINITIGELVKNYVDDGDGGVTGYDNRLVIRRWIAEINRDYKSNNWKHMEKIHGLA